MASYIARSPLTSFILEIAQTHERGIKNIVVEFADNTATGANWRVVSVDPGTVEPNRANAVVAQVALHNARWVMVEDGSDLDGQVVGKERPWDK